MNLVKSPIGRSVGAITIKEQGSGVEPKQNRTEQNKRSKRELETLQLFVNVVVVASSDKNDNQNNGLFNVINNAIFTDAGSPKLSEAFDLYGVVRLRIRGEF